MKLSKILVLAALPLALAACSVSTKSVSVAPVKPPQIARSDSKLLRLCALPVDLGDKPLAQEQVEDLWITDRQALLDCYRRHLRNFVLNATADWRVVHERRGIDGRNRLFYHAGWRAWSRVEGKVKVVEDKADKVISDLAAHKLHVAKTCTTKSGMK